MSETQNFNKTILVVDDALEIHQLLEILLKEEGYNAVCVANGQAALDYLQNEDEAPALILLDLMMPVMDGYQFREKQLLDERMAKIPVVLMTADGHIEKKREKINVPDSIKKPMNVKQLMEIVSRYV